LNGQTRRFAILMNPASAGGKPLRLLPEVEDELTRAGAPYRVLQTRDMSHARETAREAAATGEVVVALGGDGLVSALADAAREGGLLGILPGGRGNDLARSLDISQEIRPACRVLVEGAERTLDLGEANGRMFVSIASTGFDSVANRIANEARLVKGNLVYAYAALRALAGWRRAAFEVRLDGHLHRLDGYTIAIANSSYYGGGMRVAPDADPADGQFDVVFIGHTSRLRFVANLPKVFTGKHVEVDTVSTYRAREVEISADRDFEVYADGEPLTTLPATLRVLPAALRVIAPRS
jgi:YegS/Rv2252/BmrU family lipid kinase